MYIAKHFSPKEKNQIVELVKKFPFVTMISHDESGQVSISHIPVVTEVVDGEIKSIQGHFSLRNPQVAHLKNDPRVTILYHGPNSYITPNWYKSGRDVPTWNYCTVHVHGKLKISHSFEDICKNLKELTEVFEKGPGAWSFELPSDLDTPEKLAGAIASFIVNPLKIEAKFKLSQNRPMVDRVGIIEGLESRADDLSAEIKKMMNSTL